MNEPQVQKTHYEFGRYGFEGRFVSYYYQLKETLNRAPESVLEVGVGDRVFGDFIRNNTGVRYQSVDIAEDLSPDIVGSITNLPVPDNAADIVCAFEVLEHLPLAERGRAVAELVRAAKKYVIISVPHFGPMLACSLKVPLLPLLRFSWKLPFPKNHVFNGQHYWELGTRGHSVAAFRALLASHGRIVADYVPFNSPYHHFFVLECRES